MLPRRMQERDSSSFQDELVGKQKQVSRSCKEEEKDDSTASQGTTTSNSVEKHLNLQQKVFDEMSQFFDSEEATPLEVEPVLDYLVKKALVSCLQNKKQDKVGKEEEIERIKIIDVACGTGALFSSYIKAAEELGGGKVELDIRGIDLSPQMTKFAIQNGKALMEKYNGRHSIECLEAGDFVELIMGKKECQESVIGFDYGQIKGTSSGSSNTENVREEFDVCVMNACFGNFLDLGKF
jgi:Methylase involved in ubiquinone/menaquinone biosynthesis